MSLETQLNLLIAAVASDIKSINTTRGDLSSLATTDKTNLVAALNELHAAIQSAGGSIIVDTSPSTTTTYSSDKIETLITTAVAGILDSSPSALDTLNELAVALGNDENFATTISTALGNRVRVDAAQTFSDIEKTQGRDNIGAASDVEFEAFKLAVGDTEVDLVAVYTAAKA